MSDPRSRHQFQFQPIRTYSKRELHNEEGKRRNMSGARGARSKSKERVRVVAVAACVTAEFVVSDIGLISARLGFRPN